MKNKLISLLKIIVPFALGLLLIYLFYKKLSPTDKAEIVAALKRANYGWLIVSISFTFFSQIIRSWRFQALIKAIGYNISLLRSFNVISINYIVNLGIPRAGELARCGTLATYNGIPINKSIGTLVNERIVDLLLLLTTGVLTFIFQYDVFNSFYQQYLSNSFNNVFAWVLANIVISIVIGIALLVGFIFGLRFLFIANDGESKFQKLMNGFKDGFLSILRLEKPLLFIAQSIAIWVFYFFMIYFAFKTLDEGTVMGLGAALALLFFGTFGFLATPGGIGAYPLIVGYLLALYGLPNHIGSTIGWVLWIGQTVLILSLGLFAFLMLSKEKNVKVLANE